MRTRIRTALMVATVVLVAGVAFVAAALNPPGTRAWLAVCAILATVTAVQAASSEPQDLIPALLFALTPVVGLVSKGAPSWLGPPFAALLLLAAELNALSWEGPTRMLLDGALTTRLREAGLVAMLGLGLGGLLGAIAGITFHGGTWEVGVGSAGLVGVASIVFPRPVRSSLRRDRRRGPVVAGQAHVDQGPS
jgi:hypothetical protein